MQIYGLVGYEFFFEKFVKLSGPPSYILNVHSHTEWIKDLNWLYIKISFEFFVFWNLIKKTIELLFIVVIVYGSVGHRT